jgi:hypothetical protein
LVLFFRFLKQKRAQRKGAGMAAPGVYGESKASPLVSLGVYAFALPIVGIVLSVLNQLQMISDKRGTYYFFGRYFEYLALPLVLIGLYALIRFSFKKGFHLKAALFCVGIYIVAALPVQYFILPDFVIGTTKRYNMLGVLPFSGESFANLYAGARFGNRMHAYDIVGMSIVAIAILAIFVYLIMKKKHKYVAAVLLSFFVFVTFYDLAVASLPRSEASENVIFLQMQPIAEQYREQCRAEETEFDETTPICLVFEDFKNGLLGWTQSMQVRWSGYRTQLIFNRNEIRWAGTMDNWNTLMKLSSMPKRFVMITDKRYTKFEKDKRFKRLSQENGFVIYLFEGKKSGGK